jgi:hypothetical protein
MSYNYRIEYKKGKENRAADALSRRPREEHLNSISNAVPLWVIDNLSSYTDDPRYKELEEQLRINTVVVPNYTLSSGIIRYKNKIYVGANSDLRTQLIQSFHDSTLGGHPAERVTYVRLKSLFHWPGMRSTVSHFNKNYLVCQLNKSENVPYLGLLQPLLVPDMAWQHITMDFIEA